jgi:hypothetical protein
MSKTELPGMVFSRLSGTNVEITPAAFRNKLALVEKQKTRESGPLFSWIIRDFLISL